MACLHLNGSIFKGNKAVKRVLFSTVRIEGHTIRRGSAQVVFLLGPPRYRKHKHTQTHTQPLKVFK